MTRAILGFFLTCCCVQAATGRSLESVNPTAAGFNEERLQRIDRAVEAAIAARQIPGAVALIARDGKIVYQKSFGFADVEARKAMREDSIFRIASMTKAITTVSIMMLYERGHFLLSDPVSSYIPQFANPEIVLAVDDDGSVVKTKAATAEIRIIDLLTHSAGIGYSFIPSEISESYVKAGIINGVTSKPLLLEANILRIAEQPLLFEPGSAFAYGLSTDVLGYLVERVSGKTLDEFFHDEIFVPLGMENTYFYLPDKKKQRLVTLYADADGTGIAISKGNEGDIPLDNPNYPIEGAKTFFSGGAGLSSTALDYARFLQMLLNDGELDGTQLISRKSVELMRTSRIDWDGDGDMDFGLGFRVVDTLDEHTELATPGSYSWGGAFYTSYWIDPEERLIGVFMSQVRPTKSKIAERFSALVYQALQ